MHFDLLTFEKFWNLLLLPSRHLKNCGMVKVVLFFYIDSKIQFNSVVHLVIIINGEFYKLRILTHGP